MKSRIGVRDIKDFVASLYKDGKSPLEHSGMTWTELERLEEKNPGITVKKSCDEPRLAL